MRSRFQEREQRNAGLQGGSRGRSREQEGRRNLSYDARPFYMPGEGGSGHGSNDHLSPHRQHLGERLYPKVQSLRPVSWRFSSSKVEFALFPCIIKYKLPNFVFMYSHLPAK